MAAIWLTANTTCTNVKGAQWRTAPPGTTTLVALVGLEDEGYMRRGTTIALALLMLAIVGALIVQLAIS